MELKEFIVKFAEILDETTPESLSPETNFQELSEWSSMALLALIALADEEYGADISGKEIKSVNTISELFQLIKVKS